MSLRRSLLTSFLINVMVFTLAGCVVAVAPLHRSTSITLDRAPPAPPAIVAPPPAEPDAKPPACPMYVPPASEAIPRVPNFTQAERNDPDKLNEQLVAYIGTLRSYMARNARSHDDTYTRYQTQCLKGAL